MRTIMFIAILSKNFINDNDEFREKMEEKLKKETKKKRSMKTKERG